MPKKASAGLLLYRRRADLEVFLVHPGGPFWAKKDAGAWSLPKGEFEEGEDPLHAAKREFAEETGFTIDGEFRRLEPTKQRGGKVVHAWAIAADYDASKIRSNLFSLEWPPCHWRVVRQVLSVSVSLVSSKWPYARTTCRRSFPAMSGCSNLRYDTSRRKNHVGTAFPTE